MFARVPILIGNKSLEVELVVWLPEGRTGNTYFLSWGTNRKCLCLHKCLQTFTSVFKKNLQSLQCWHQKRLKCKNNIEGVLGQTRLFRTLLLLWVLFSFCHFAKCVLLYFWLDYHFTKSKIEHQCRVILLEHFLLKIMTIQYQVHFGEFLIYNILNKWDKWGKVRRASKEVKAVNWLQDLPSMQRKEEVTI